MKTTQEMIAVMQAAVDGKQIEYRRGYCCDGPWSKIEHANWDWVAFDYRIAPEPPPKEPKMPDAPVWWCATVSRNFLFMPKILKDGSGTTIGTWEVMAMNGDRWSPDRKRWFNFYGEEVEK